LWAEVTDVDGSRTEGVLVKRVHEEFGDIPIEVYGDDIEGFFPKMRPMFHMMPWSTYTIALFLADERIERTDPTWNRDDRRRMLDNAASACRSHYGDKAFQTMRAGYIEAIAKTHDEQERLYLAITMCMPLDDCPTCMAHTTGAA